MKNNTITAIGLMVVGMILIPVGDSIAKWLLNTTPYSPQLIAWVRFFIGGLVVLPFALQGSRFDWLEPVFLKKQLLRAILIVLTVVTIIKAVGMSPIADVFGAFFIGPILSVVLSSLLLRERATKLEWGSVVLGFMGVLLVVQPVFIMQLIGLDVTPGIDARTSLGVRPDTDLKYTELQSGGAPVSTSGVYWALLAGIFYGSFLTATRWAAASGPPMVQVAVQFLLAGLLLTPFGLYDLAQHGFHEPLWLFANAVTSVLANLLSIMALARARPATLAPVVYMQVVAATIIGLFVFQESLSVLATLGISIIVLSGLLRIDFQSLYTRR